MSSCVPCIKRQCNSLTFPSRNHRISGVQKSHQRCLESLAFLEVNPDGTVKSLSSQSSEEPMTYGVRSSVQASRSQFNQDSACSYLAPEPRAFPKQHCSSKRSISVSSLHSHNSLGKTPRVLKRWLSAYKHIHFEFGSSTHIRRFMSVSSPSFRACNTFFCCLMVPAFMCTSLHTYTCSCTHTLISTHTQRHVCTHITHIQIWTERMKDAQIELYFNIMHFLKCKNVAHLIRKGTFPSHSISSVIKFPS